MSDKVFNNMRVYLGAIKNMHEINKLYCWINDKELVNLSSSFTPIHFSNHLEWFNNIRQDKSCVLFGIRKICNNELIGSCQLHSINHIYKKAELQIRFGLDNVSKGYGKEALFLLINYGFNDLNLNKIYLHVFDTNHRAISLYKSLGFTQEGILRDDAYICGKYVDVLVMSILRREWIK
ncbi:hypothetical protein CHL9426_05565 [Campylobacter hyointestinalis subsp. lawsonii]|uniref:GNAT family N-acetyltransferase n=3 Tax=Campylobacter hyointestinalis TaxID=198 RepID=A0AAV6EHH6_CAMHY|nr:GNAT family protein [Campylobacter hyointestinalis]KAB0613637.1 GNAT family N-acetyltransferase [Campylobacter hyointestinalis subsp. lawsonii]QKF68693.1 acetyltransferase (GNAT family) [Campylobacter hyointestinalis subsp. lawsonii]RAZ24210.1 hypothetical protein CHL9752_05630 [Campylobacter hyointestinalis subsp. lawsonii]RAZ28563.1 hypothetical protein CHLT_04150 [Campylobacter hyointestinalis subsp. lawsonii]RAZ38560.1 hypothetical protein CHL9426_05565 [Campylobacter hyointestinalis su